MIVGSLGKISCMLVDVIKETMASCDYRNCDEICYDYLMDVASNCDVVFHNQVYSELWNTLFKICDDIGEQTSPFFIDK
jgi:hypothetical protein